ncbi:uncharacterized protein LOC125034843 [Penaeus chinensis]|uniref:uncharacterized protein LOC125034843 n=1 Tax=Penaeus chinensis TaxID=139456 RepID=UPI001FB5F234|nr:uncharacterized protein LOC125034843 [Penaeus chinensis]
MPRNHRGMAHLRILSANVRGFQTVLGDLTHSHIIPHQPDIIAAVETFLNSTVPENFGRVGGYSKWHRRDRMHGSFGDIAVYFRRTLHWQGSEPLVYLQANLDNILHAYYIIILGDLNQHLVERSFEKLPTTFGLTNNVHFPTHISGSSLDPVITDLAESDVSCTSLGTFGSSDHFTVLNKISLKAAREGTLSRTIRQWEKAEWQGMCDALSETPWEDILTGTVDRQALVLTKILVSLQAIYVPNKTYKTKSTDQPWFGYTCRMASDKKMRAWNRYKRYPTQSNREFHAMQGFSPDDCTPPLNKPDGSVATSSREKAELLTSLFSEKMRVHDLDRSSPSLPLVTPSKLSSFVIAEAEVRQRVYKGDVHKAIGPNKVSPHTLHRSQRSAPDLLLHLTTIWHQALDTRKDTFVVALDIAGSFYRTWQKGLASKLKSFGINGNLLMLLEDYLQERTLRLIPEAYAYADDCTLNFTYDTQNRGS